MEKLTHDELLSEWKSAREYKSFTNDGILIEDKWKQSSPKILFLLKESNAGFDNIAGRGWGPNGNSNTFWRRINICSYIITEIWNDRKPSFHEVATVKEREVNSIAYVNVKKNGENKSTSNNNEILQYARNDKDYLARQISIINPDVIYCGGTINSYKHLFPCEEIGENLYSSEGRLIIAFYHPSYSKSFEKIYEGLLTILQNFKISDLKNNP